MFHHSGLNAIGHELHFTRHIIMDMYNQNYITNNDTIVTCTKERFFFYSNIFSNIILYEDFIKMEIPDNNILHIFNFMHTSIDNIEENVISNFETKSNYPIREILFNKMERNYDNLLKNFNYPLINKELIEKKFFLIHHRYFLKACIGYESDKTIEFIIKIIEFLKNNYPNINIIIYSQNNNQLFGNDIKQVSTLDMYASLMNHDNCIALISEISGAGELGQYCHNKYLYMYGNAYNFNYKDIYDNSNQLSGPLHLNGLWNKKGCTNVICKRIGILDELLDDILVTIKN